MRLRRFAPAGWLASSPRAEEPVSWGVAFHRNVASLPFPPRMTEADREALLRRFREEVLPAPLFAKGEFVLFDSLNEVEELFLREEGWVPQGFRPGPWSAGVFLPERHVSVLVNGAEHVTVLVRGPVLKRVLESAARVDGALLARLDIAFSERFGFLTSNADILGNGMMVWAVVVRGGLRRAGGWRDVERWLEDDDLGWEPLWSGVGGDLVRIVHKEARYFLAGEEDMAEDFRGKVERVVSWEAEARRRLDGLELKDEVSRAWGLLASALKLDLGECLHALELLYWAGSEPEREAARGFLTGVQPGHLALIYGEAALDRESAKVFRARYLRDMLGRTGLRRRRHGA